MSRILSFDFGLRHIGVAVGNDVTQSATAQQALKARDGIPDPKDLQKLIKDWQPSLCVVGLPLNMDGSEQEMTRKARKFGNRLSSDFKVRVVFIDERLTSASAKEEIFEQGGFRALKNGKDRIDSLSAVEILEQYFSEHACSGASDAP